MRRARSFTMPVTSLLDTDLYKFTMGNFALRFTPGTAVRCTFINRNGHPFPKDFGRNLRAAVDALGSLSLTPAELDFLQSSCPWINTVFLEHLRGLRLDPSEVRIDQEGGNLRITIEGPWPRTIYWEVPLLATISELYFTMTGVRVPADESVCEDIARHKADVFRRHGIRFIDFGTRRRFSFAHHERVVATLAAAAGDCLAGTSNLLLAMRFGLRPSGTQAHELYSLMGALHGSENANTATLEKWLELYPGTPGVALTDTFGSAAFFRTFDKPFAMRFDGVRQDSGDPLDFLECAIAHYESLGIDPSTKTIVFSDALDMDKVLRIDARCRGRINALYGIGSYLTNNLPGVVPLNIVIKLTAVETPEGWRPAVKLTDDPGKASGDPEAIRDCRRRIGDWLVSPESEKAR